MPGIEPTIPPSRSSLFKFFFDRRKARAARRRKERGKDRREAVAR